MEKQINHGRIFGEINIPPSKSDSQRAILAAALVQGQSLIHNVGGSNDEVAMLANVQLLGAKVTSKERGVKVIQGITHFPEEISLNVGESGLGLRLLTAICAAHFGKHEINGEGSILIRPQGFFEQHFTELGARVSSNNGFLPLRLEGKLHGGKLEVDGSMSSQFLSGLLMALPLLDKDSEVVVNNLKSIPYVEMTLSTLREFGVEINHDDYTSFRIKGNQNYHPTEYFIESDWSSSSYWLVASALRQGLKLKGLSSKSQQADIAMLDALKAANCEIISDASGIMVNGIYRKPFDFDATHCPDLFPALVTLATFCDGVSIIDGVDRLKNKESDRGLVLQEEFGKLGVKIELLGDKMHIHGGGKLQSGVVQSHNDHRIAMCLAIAGVHIENGITIEGAEAVKKSYPDFWKHFDECFQKM